MPVRIAQVEDCFKSAGPQPNGLQASDDGLWCIDQRNNRLYRQDYTTGEVLFDVQTDTVHSSGVTVGGGYVWIASTYEKKIAQLELDTGKTVAKHSSPGSGVVGWREGAADAQETGAHGLEWRDDRLYVASPPSQMVHVIDPDGWRETNCFRVPGLRVHGIAWAEDGNLWAADTSAGTVSLLDPHNGRIYDVFRVEAPDEVHGMTIYDGVLWFCNASNCKIGRLLVD